jgi:hypothetical protein
VPAGTSLGPARFPAVRREKLPPIGTTWWSQPSPCLNTRPEQELPSSGTKAISFDGDGSTPEDNLRLTSIAILLVVSSYVGLLWKPKIWAIQRRSFTSLTSSCSPHSLRSSRVPGRAFGQGHGGFFWDLGLLDYWLSSTVKSEAISPRITTALTPLYEFLPLLLAFGGAIWLALKGDSFKRWPCSAVRHLRWPR